MQELKKILKEQVVSMKRNEVILTDGLAEILRLLKLQAAEAKLGNARMDMIDGSLQKLLAGVNDLGDTAKNLLEELK